jgi:thiol:disulfide interchange protein DsbC
MKKLSLFAAFICLWAVFCVFSANTSHAAERNKTVLTPEQIKSKLEKSFENIKFEKVIPAPQWPGMYEVVTESELAYTNADASILFAGQLVDTSTKENLSRQRWNDLNKVDVSSLPLENAIKTVKGDGSRTLFLFSDPDCPFCQELEKELAEVTNITIYTFLYPLEELHPQARDKANNIWCSADRVKSWNDWMSSKVLAYNSCEQTVIKSNIEFGMRLKINSTPTLFFADGHRVDGKISKEQLENELTATKR